MGLVRGLGPAELSGAGGAREHGLIVAGPSPRLAGARHPSPSGEGEMVQRLDSRITKSAPGEVAFNSSSSFSTVGTASPRS